MIRKRIIHKPFDLGFDILYNECPEDLLELINAPGKFVRKANVNVYVGEGDKARMDTSYIANPDYKTLFRTAVCNGEHQSTPVDDDKLEMMGDYMVQQIHDENLPQFSWVASHIPKEKHKQEIEYTASNIIRPIFLDLGEEDNKKRLNTVTNIITQQDHISKKDALNLGIIVLFAPRDRACEITEEVVELYVKIADQLSKKVEYTVYSVLRIMVDAYFDEESEYERLINMLDNNTSVEATERFVSLEIMHNDLEAAHNDLEIAHNDLEAAHNDLEVAENRIKELEAKVEELEGQLDSK